MTALSSDNLAILQAQNSIQAGKSLPSLSAGATKTDGKFDISKARKTATNFEAMFLAEMFKPMFKDIQPAEPFGGGPAARVWRDMETQEYAKAIAKNGGIGLAKAVLNQMIQMQERKK